jgi:LSD1 subclass zinc finger protein
VNLWDWLSRPEEELVLWGSTFAALLALFVLGAFGRRRARGLQGLHKALAARPPAREGGAELCRECGAPLTVPKNALGVRCACCKADNLVAIPAAWLSRARGSAARVAREASGALREHRVELRKLRVRLVVRFAILAAVATALLTSVVRRVVAGDGGPFDLRAALSTAPRRLFDAQPRATLEGAPGPAAPRVPVDQCAATYRLERGEDLSCLDGDCWVGWFVALRSGETLEVGATPGGVAHLYAHTSDRGWNEAYGRPDLWGTEIAHDALASDRRARFAAPCTSWYRVTLELHGVGAGEEIHVCAGIR